MAFDLFWAVIPFTAMMTTLAAVVFGIPRVVRFLDR